jgi:signal transduction histidine kinase
LGFRGVFAASLALVIVLAMLTVGFAYSELDLETQANFWVDHSHQVIEQNQLVVTLIERAESAERSYQLSGDYHFVPVVAAAVQTLPTAEADLARLVVDSPDETARVGALNRVIAWRAARVQATMQLAQKGDLAKAKAVSLDQTGRPPGPSLRALSDGVDAAERVLLEDRVRRSADVSQVSVATGLMLAVVSLLALLGFVLYLSRSNQNLVRAMAEAARATADRDRAEERLRAAQRLEVVGQLTGGVAHDFNNLLQVVRGNLELLAPALKDAANRRRLDNAVHAVDRAAELTRQLLAFARRQPLQAQSIDLARMIGDMTEILRRTLGGTTEVETEIAPDLWPALADPSQMESAILNLAINARDAMPDGGRLTIIAANQPQDGENPAADGPPPGDYVQVTVADTGKGMTPEVRERAFEPFFSTKGEGKGSGLGLSMVYGFVRQSGGFMRLESEPGAGTRVTLLLPRSAEEAEEPPPPAPVPAAAAGTTILVVEDDAAVRLTAVTLLNALGYECLEASDAAQAVELVRSAGQIDLVFSDVVMPGAMRAQEMVEAIATLRPDLPILFASGYPREELGAGGQLTPEVNLILKPYARDDLAARVAQLLSAGAA